MAGTRPITFRGTNGTRKYANGKSPSPAEEFRQERLTFLSRHSRPSIYFPGGWLSGASGLATSSSSNQSGSVPTTPHVRLVRSRKLAKVPALASSKCKSQSRPRFRASAANFPDRFVLQSALQRQPTTGIMAARSDRIVDTWFLIN